VVGQSSPSRRGTGLWIALVALVLAACGGNATPAQTTPTVPPPTVAPAMLFPTLPPGTALPAEADCAARVRRSPWEPRPENRQANHTVPATLALGEWSGHNERANRELLPRITGNFTGTTDEILQWGACKWGLDENLVRAVAVQESDWRQAMVGDTEDDPSHCAPGYATPCPTSFGITQVRWYVWPGTFPHARDSTALAVDYWGGLVRSCYEGYVDWLHSFTDVYEKGDLWGCVGFWYAGRWYDDLNQDYIAKVQRRLANMEWLSPTFTERGGSIRTMNCEMDHRATRGPGRVPGLDLGSAAIPRTVSTAAAGDDLATAARSEEAGGRLPALRRPATPGLSVTTFRSSARRHGGDSGNEEAAWT
jgi:autotransporter family porin